MSSLYLSGPEAAQLILDILQERLDCMDEEGLDECANYEDCECAADLIEDTQTYPVSLALSFAQGMQVSLALEQHGQLATSGETAHSISMICRDSDLPCPDCSVFIMEGCATATAD